MRRIIFLLCFMSLTIIGYAQSHEPGNNLGKSLSSMKQQFPELRFLKSDEKGDEYQDGYTEDGIGTFFYFKNGYVIEECMACQSKDGFPREWFNSMVNAFGQQYPYALKRNTQNTKQFVFSTFNVNLVYLSESDGTNTAMIVYEKTKNTEQSSSVYSQNTPSYQSSRPAPKGKVEWYEIDYTYNQNDVRGMESVGYFNATSSPVIFGSRSENDALMSALKKIKKKAAKKGVRRLLITYNSDLNWDFLTMKVEAVGYK